jgi:hypothetical protein
MNAMNFRPILAPLLGISLCFTLSSRPGLAGRTDLAEQFVAQAVSVSSSESSGPVSIYIERWSTDEELNNLLGPIMSDDAASLLPVLQRQKQRAGVVLMPGVGAHGARVRTRTPKNLLFARAIDTPTGRRVIVASDEHLGLGEPRLEARKEVSEFNLMDIRFGPDGKGVAKVAGPGDVAFDPVTKVLELKNYAMQPARLIDVRSEKP